MIVCILISVGIGPEPRPGFWDVRGHVTWSPLVPPLRLVSPNALPWVTLTMMLEN